MYRGIQGGMSMGDGVEILRISQRMWNSKMRNRAENKSLRRGPRDLRARFIWRQWHFDFSFTALRSWETKLFVQVRKWSNEVMQQRSRMQRHLYLYWNSGWMWRQVLKNHVRAQAIWNSPTRQCSLSILGRYGMWNEVVQIRQEKRDKKRMVIE